MKVITTFEYGKERFEMVKFDKDCFGGINHKYITNGKLNRELNGLQMFTADTLERSMRLIIIRIELDKMGHTKDTPLEEYIQMFNKASGIAHKII